MSRLSNAKKLKDFRHAEKMAAEESRAIQRRRHSKPVSKSMANITPKRQAVWRKWGVII